MRSPAVDEDAVTSTNSIGKCSGPDPVRADQVAGHDVVNRARIPNAHAVGKVAGDQVAFSGGVLVAAVDTYPVTLCAIHNGNALTTITDRYRAGNIRADEVACYHILVAPAIGDVHSR